MDRTAAAKTSGHPTSSFGHQQELQLLLRSIITTSSSFFSKFARACFKMVNLFNDELEYSTRHPTTSAPQFPQSEWCLLNNQHLPWARGWRGRAGCPGWIVRSPWRCKDRRCCCCNCCICKSCCWKANCWVATCCCCKRSGRKKNEMAVSQGRWNYGRLKTHRHRRTLRMVTRVEGRAQCQGWCDRDRAHHLWKRWAGGSCTFSAACSHRKTTCQSRQLLLQFEFFSYRPEFL